MAKMNILTIVIALIVLCASSAYAAHTATGELNPEWSPASTLVLYDVEICNQAGSDAIDEVRVIKNPMYADIDCEDLSGDGWITTKISPWFDGDVGGLTEMCWFFTIAPGNNLGAEECQIFEFSATTPGVENCELNWKFETRDEESSTSGDWESIFVSTGVDSTPPVLVKEITSGPYDERDGSCPPAPDSDEECWITQHTTINVEVTDPGDATCEGEDVIPSGMDHCVFSLDLDGAFEENWTVYDNELGDLNDNTDVIEHDVQFDEDSFHELTITCYDVAGNMITEMEKFRVDDEEPVTAKNFTGPQKLEAGPAGTIEWIDGVTVINLFSEDPEADGTPWGYDCSIGVDKTWYRVNLLEGEMACWEPNTYCNAESLGMRNPYDANGMPECLDIAQDYCTGLFTPNTGDWFDCVEDYAWNSCDLGTDWRLYRGVPIGGIEESCHAIQYFSVDHLGNVEDSNFNCFFVDKTPPIMTKTNGEPKVPLCELGSESFNETVFSQNVFDSSASLVWDGTGATWTVDLAGIDGHWHTGAQVIVTDGETPLFLIGWSSENTAAPIYKEYNGGWGAWTDVLPAGMTVSGNYNENHYVITIPAEYLDCSYTWALNTEASWPGHSSAVQQNFPADWGRWTATNAYPFHNGMDWWVTSGTDITFDCYDPLPHPSGDEELCMKVSYDLADDGYLTEEYCGNYSGTMDGDWCCFDMSVPDGDFFVKVLDAPVQRGLTINFMEESLHDLEYFCRDAVEKTTEVEVQYYRVDDTPPMLEKVVSDPKEGICPPAPGSADVCFITPRTNITVNVWDPDPTGQGCNVDEVYCAWEYTWNSTLIVGTAFSEPGGIITFPEDSQHDLRIVCHDQLGNTYVDEETFFVDDIPPTTTKVIGEPLVMDYWPKGCMPVGDIQAVPLQYLVEGDGYIPPPCGVEQAEWITSQTPITLESLDVKSGVKDIYWRNLLVPGEDGERICGHVGVDTDFGDACHPDVYMQHVNNSENWTVYDGAFTKDEDSCHIVEYWAVDKVGNEELLKWNCVFVDNQPPTVNKTVGEPRVECVDPVQGNDTDCDGGRTYTVNGDFDEGTLFNVQHDTVADQLQLELGEATTFPVMWVANAGEDTVSKWDTENDIELARYHTWFGPKGNHGAWEGPAPSRTAVDSEGNVYVANRQFDGRPADVFKILADDWIDRNSNSVLDTSTDGDTSGTIESGEMLQMVDSNTNGVIDPEEITDERVAWVTSVGPSNCIGRSLAIDLDGNIWLGCYGTSQYYKLDGTTGAIIAGPIATPGHTPYGALVDKHGILWGASLSNNLLRLDTSTNAVTTYNDGYGNYGIALGYDGSDNTQVYLAGSSVTYRQFDSSTNTFSSPAALYYQTRGIATDIDGNIVAAGGAGVSKFAPDGSLIWTGTAQVSSSDPRGTQVDSNGDVWVIYRDVNKLGKHDGTTGAGLGVVNSGLYPYTYSDATGLGFRGSVSQGSWNVIYDGSVAAASLGPVSWNDDIPQGTELTVKVRSSENAAVWSPWETVTDGGAFATTPAGRYLEVQVSFKGTSEFSPALFDLTVTGGCGSTPRECWFITQGTPIDFTCTDDNGQLHPVDHVSLWYRYRLSQDCENWGDWTNWTDPQAQPNGNPYVVHKTFFFPEDSCHEIEYTCEDGLGNEYPVQSEIDIVDTVAPVTTKTYLEPFYTNGVSDWVDTASRVMLEAVDPDPHPVGVEDTFYRITWFGDDDMPCEDPATYCHPVQSVENFTSYTTPFPIAEESCHLIEFYSVDELGNQELLNYQCVFADHTAPNIVKTYSEPYYTETHNDSLVEWISVETQINIAVADADPHPSGLDTVDYRVTLLGSDEACWDETICQGAEGSGDWEEGSAEFSFSIGEESCHLIEIVAVDNVEKTRTHKQCVFVDDTAPFPNKTVGIPKEPMSEDNQALGAVFYPELGENICDEDGKCWDITMMTPIDLACVDPVPHPSGATEVCFNVDFDNEDVTADYCANAQGAMIDNGYCCVEQLGEFRFNKQSWHKLSYYCVDNVDNSGEEDVDIEYFKVGETAFKIQLNKKWNLISVPVKLLDNSMDEVFEGLEDVVVSVWQYDGTNWHIYTPDGIENDDITTMHPGWGYWILTTDAANLTIGGNLLSPAITPPSVPVVHGWNLLGYFGAEEETVYDEPDGDGQMAQCVLYNIGDSIWDKQFGAVDGYWEPYNPNMWTLYGRWDNLDPGAGYWVFATEDGIHTLPPKDCGGLIA